MAPSCDRHSRLAVVYRLQSPARDRHGWRWRQRVRSFVSSCDKVSCSPSPGFSLERLCSWASDAGLLAGVPPRTPPFARLLLRVIMTLIGSLLPAIGRRVDPALRAGLTCVDIARVSEPPPLAARQPFGHRRTVALTRIAGGAVRRQDVADHRFRSSRRHGARSPRLALCT